MLLRLDQMTDADIDRLAERHYDRLFDLYYGTGDEEDAWDMYKPDWTDIADLVDSESWHNIAELIRDYLEGDGDLMDAVCDAGLLEPYIAPEDAWMLKDPDDKWQLVDSTFEREWNNDTLMGEIYKWLPENHLEKMCRKLLDNADDNGIREKYNESKKEW